MGYRYGNPERDKERRRLASVAMWGFLEALRPHGLTLMFPNPDKKGSAVDAAAYGDADLPGLAWLRRVDGALPEADKDYGFRIACGLTLTTDGVDEAAGKPFHVSLIRGVPLSDGHNRRSDKLRFKKGSVLPTPEMVSALIQLLPELDRYVAAVKDHSDRTSEAIRVLKARCVLREGDPSMTYKGFSVSPGADKVVARWSWNLTGAKKCPTPDEMARIVARLVIMTPGILRKFSASDMVLEFPISDVDRFVEAARAVEAAYASVGA